MIFNVNSLAKTEIDIDEKRIFEMLCTSLYMDFVLEEDTDYFVRKDEYGDNAVYVAVNGSDHKIDDRGDLFVALRNVAFNIFPNVGFRNADYIQKYEFKEW